MLVVGTGLEPVHRLVIVFETIVSANSTTRPFCQFFHRTILLTTQSTDFRTLSKYVGNFHPARTEWFRFLTAHLNGHIARYSFAGVEGLEPPTYGLTVRRSNQLNYTPLCGPGGT